LGLACALGQIENQTTVPCEALERTAVLLDVQEVRGRMRVSGMPAGRHTTDALRVVVEGAGEMALTTLKRRCWLMPRAGS
jgi:hypothetical protein